MSRTDGYAPIRDYAAIGDGRTAALVARDGSIDWLCLPDIDSPGVFSRILDSERGGAFELSPREPFETERRYEPGTNVLSTTYRTATGSVRVTDALTLGGRPACVPLRRGRSSCGRPLRQGADALAGRAAFRFGKVKPRIDRKRRPFVAAGAHDALLVQSWDAGAPGSAGTESKESSKSPRPAVRCSPRRSPQLRAARHFPAFACHRAPRATRRFWRGWSSRSTYDGAWPEAVARSVLALKLLVHAPSGAIVAAPTTSLPERIGGDANWDYRFAWPRDASFTLEAFLRLGYHDEARAFFWWLMQTTRLTHPRLHTIYRVNGNPRLAERELQFAGYRGSRPVRLGNKSSKQLQLDVYGDVLDAILLYADCDGRIDRDTAKQVAEIADYVGTHWQEPDSGIWELRGEPQHYTQSKALCWVALDRASQLAERGIISDRRERWQPEAQAIKRFVHDRCWDDERNTFVRAPGDRHLDASLLTLSTFDFIDVAGPRMTGTIDAIRAELADGPYVSRFRSAGPGEGAFLACSFWLAASLARAGQLDDAVAMFEQLVGLANDVGLYAEEIDPATNAFLGNFPQGLTHLALINAAVAIEGAQLP